MSTRSTLLLTALALALAACSKSSPDQAAPARSPEPAPAAAPARPLTVSGVYIDPEFASACGITGAEAYFDFDSAALSVPEGSALDLVADCLTGGVMKDRRVELVGYTDPRGSDEHNEKLGESRAESVRDFLVDRGLSRDRVDTFSMGEYGGDPNDPSEWPYDRRVELRLVRQ